MLLSPRGRLCVGAEGTAEHRARGAVRRPGGEERDDAPAPEAVPFVAARGGDAAVEEKAPVPVVEEDLARCLRSEADGLPPVDVDESARTGDLDRGAPEVGALPALGHVTGLEHDDPDGGPGRVSGHEPGELAHAG